MWLLSGVSLALSSFFPAHFTANAGIQSLIGSILLTAMAVPSYWVLLKVAGKGGAIAVIGLGIFALGIEATSIVTGWPYGYFEYGTNLGLKLGGLVPWTVTLAWPPLVIGSWYLLPQQLATWKKIVLAAVLLVLLDLVLDPGAVALQMWSWQNPGIYYQIPWSNFGGWFITGLIGSAWLSWWVKDCTILANQRNWLVSGWWWHLWFWTGVAVWLGFWLPACLGVVLIVLSNHLIVLKK